MSDETRIPKASCPNCGYVMDAATALKEAATPRPNDFTLCLNCGVLHRFNADMTLRPATSDDLAQLDPLTAMDIGHATALILKRGRIWVDGKPVKHSRGRN